MTTARDDDALLLAGTLTASLAHDLRGVLGVIRTAATLASRPERTAHELKKIERNAEKGLQAVEAILGLIRNECPLIETIDLSVISLIAMDSVESSMNLTNTSPSMLVRSSVSLLTSALVVLFENSAKAGATSVRLEAQALEVDGSRRTILDIIDNGPGLEASRAELLFAARTSFREGGTGLGLWFARYALTQCGGTIEAVPSREEGACFRMTLPSA